MRALRRVEGGAGRVFGGNLFLKFFVEYLIPFDRFPHLQRDTGFPVEVFLKQTSILKL
jgi:hypothetical protein